MSKQFSIISFADKSLYKSKNRFIKQANRFRNITNVKVYTNDDLIGVFDHYIEKNFNYKSLGFGYWIWKPFIIYNELIKLKENDFLLYADIGCDLNWKGEERLIKYFVKARNSKFGILPGKLIYSEYNDVNYSSQDSINLFNISNSELIETQYFATSIILCNNHYARKIIFSWLNICRNNYEILKGYDFKNSNNDNFISHRHDQSFFSLLMKEMKIDHVCGSEFIKQKTIRSYPKNKISIQITRIQDEEKPILHSRNLKFDYLFLASKVSIKFALKKAVKYSVFFKLPIKLFLILKHRILYI